MFGQAQCSISPLYRLASVGTALVIGLVVLCTISSSDLSAINLGAKASREALRDDRDWDLRDERDWDHLPKSRYLGQFQGYGYDRNRPSSFDDRDNADTYSDSEWASARHGKHSLRGDREYVNDNYDIDDRSYRPYREEISRRDRYRDEMPVRREHYRAAHYDDDDDDWRFSSSSRWDPEYEFKRQDLRSARLSSPDVVDWEMDMERGLDRLDDDAENLREREEANLQLQEHWLGMLQGRRWDGIGDRGIFYAMLVVITFLLTILMCICLLCIRRYRRSKGTPSSPIQPHLSKIHPHMLCILVS